MQADKGLFSAARSRCVKKLWQKSLRWVSCLINRRNESKLYSVRVNLYRDIHVARPVLSRPKCRGTWFCDHKLTRSEDGTTVCKLFRSAKKKRLFAVPMSSRFTEKNSSSATCSAFGEIQRGLLNLASAYQGNAAQDRSPWRNIKRKLLQIP